MIAELHYARKIGFREYRIPQEEREILDQWKEQVQQVVDILLIEPFNKETVIQELNKRGLTSGSLDSALSRIESEKYNENKRRLLAIGLWVDSVKGRWSWASSVLKVIIGGDRRLSSAVKGKGSANCIDTAVLTQVMCQEFGISGQVQTISEKTPHHYFIASTGEIIDVWKGKARGGLFVDDKDYDENRSRQFDHPCDR